MEKTEEGNLKGNELMIEMSFEIETEIFNYYRDYDKKRGFSYAEE